MPTASSAASTGFLSCDEKTRVLFRAEAPQPAAEESRFMNPLGSPELPSDNGSKTGGPCKAATWSRTRPAIYHLMVSLALALLVPFGAGRAFGQGQELAPIKVDLPQQPNFNINNAPEQYPTGELSIYGLR